MQRPVGNLIAFMCILVFGGIFGFGIAVFRVHMGRFLDQFVSGEAAFIMTVCLFVGLGIRTWRNRGKNEQVGN